ncbi:uncharacterized protein [Pleurodeles waltl]|uniref:uncharacterized protein n=1 Tax=Pleurodeles waltl TaxID=8319 RepID=UPI0037095BFD
MELSHILRRKILPEQATAMELKVRYLMQNSPAGALELWRFLTETFLSPRAEWDIVNFLEVLGTFTRMKLKLWNCWSNTLLTGSPEALEDKFSNASKVQLQLVVFRLSLPSQKPLIQQPKIMSSFEDLQFALEMKKILLSLGMGEERQLNHIWSKTVEILKRSRKQRHSTRRYKNTIPSHAHRHRGDSAFAVRTYMMMPYLNPTTPAERRYNAAHMATQNAVERTFGLLKSHFRCLHKSGGALQYSPETTCRIVATCAILHNIATTRGIPVEISDTESDEDDDPIPPLQPADRTSAAEGRQRRADITHNHFRRAAVST